MKYALMFLLLATSGWATINISSNQLYTFNYTNESNISTNETFFCSFNQSLCPISSTVSLNLSAGDNVSTVNGTCSINAICAASNSTTNTCVVRKTLGSGDRYTNTAAGCDIDISVRKDEGSISSGLVPVTVPVSLEKTQSQIILKIGNLTRSVDANLSSFITYDTPILCPVNIDLESETNQKKVLDICTDIIPGLANHLRSTLESCDKSIADHTADVKVCDEQKSVLYGQIGELQAKVSQLEQQARDADNRTESIRLDLALCKTDDSTHTTIAWFCGVMLFVCLIVIAFLSRGTLWGN